MIISYKRVKKNQECVHTRASISVCVSCFCLHGEPKVTEPMRRVDREEEEEEEAGGERDYSVA